MFTDKRAKPLSGSLTYDLMAVAVAFMLTGALVLIGCDSNDVTEEPDVEITAVAISPDSVSLEVGESVEFSVVGLTADGDTIQNPDLDIEWWSTDTDVFTVEAGGIATGQDSGSAYCMIETADQDVTDAVTTNHLRSSTSFTGRDSAIVFVFMF